MGYQGKKAGHFFYILGSHSSLKSNLSKFRFRLIFIFNKKEPQSYQFFTN